MNTTPMRAVPAVYAILRGRARRRGVQTVAFNRLPATAREAARPFVPRLLTPSAEPLLPCPRCASLEALVQRNAEAPADDADEAGDDEGDDGDERAHAQTHHTRAVLALHQERRCAFARHPRLPNTQSQTPGELLERAGPSGAVSVASFPSHFRRDSTVAMEDLLAHVRCVFGAAHNADEWDASHRWLLEFQDAPEAWEACGSALAHLDDVPPELAHFAAQVRRLRDGDPPLGAGAPRAAEQERNSSSPTSHSVKRGASLPERGGR